MRTSVYLAAIAALPVLLGANAYAGTPAGSTQAQPTRDASDVLTVAALCRIAGASERTLHYAFVERYGLPPARFMKACRLNGARSDFSRIDSQTVKISDVANKWGFWHLGQFAKDYRLWFGELPSETFRRNHADN